MTEQVWTIPLTPYREWPKWQVSLSEPQKLWEEVKTALIKGIHVSRLWHKRPVSRDENGWEGYCLLPLTPDLWKWGGENTQCCSIHSSGMYPARDGHDRSIFSRPVRITTVECIVSRRPFYRSLTSPPLCFILAPSLNLLRWNNYSSLKGKKRGNSLCYIPENI